MGSYMFGYLPSKVITRIISIEHCCTFCTPPYSVTWSHGTVSVYISTPMTAKYMSASPSTTLRQQSRSCMVTCVDDINDRMSSSRLRLNPSKTQVMWLNSSHQVQQINVTSISVLSENIDVVETARDLDVVIDSQMSLSAHTHLCALSICVLPALTTTSSRSVADSRGCQNIRSGIHSMPPRLL